jgi:hypothetical protein
MSHTFELVRNANVDVKKIVDDKKKVVAEITINDKYQHRFPVRSRVSKHLELMEPKHLAERLTGGSYFMIDDQLIDFRDGGYNGFMHEDDTLAVFMNLLGVTAAKDLPLARQRNRASDEEDPGSKLALRKVWSDHNIVVPGYAQGGEFTSQLSYTWNPFVKTINSAFDLVRLICTNGMVGTTTFLNTKIPLFNRWEEHLDIASRQIQNKVTSTVIARVQQMTNERASVADCLLLESHAFNRFYSGAPTDLAERNRLENIMRIVDPKIHLREVYRDGVFEDKALAAQLPGHLTHFDVFNIATELRSHTNAVGKSSDHALDRFANGVLFDNDRDYAKGIAGLTTPKLSMFSDPEAAFYGQMAA